MYLEVVYIALKFYQCSEDPINECREELYKADVSRPIGTLETMCFIMPNFDADVCHTLAFAAFILFSWKQNLTYSFLVKV